MYILGYFVAHPEKKSTPAIDTTLVKGRYKFFSTRLGFTPTTIQREIEWFNMIY